MLEPPRPGRGLLARGALLLVLTGAASCTPSYEFKQVFQITDVSGGWYDYGIVDGKNKLVPTIMLRVRKQPTVQLTAIAVNVHFKKIKGPETKDEEEFDEVFLQRVEFSQGDQTDLLTVRSEHGYTGDAPQTRAQMLEHSAFIDMRARIFAKQSSTTWVELLSYDIPRVLITK